MKRFVPKFPNELYEYARSHGVQVKNYKSWLWNNLRDAIEFAYDVGFELVALRYMSKAPFDPQNEPSEFGVAAPKPIKLVTSDMALDWIARSGHELSYGNLGIRAGTEFVLLDYDSQLLTPELEWLASKTLTIMTPNGYTFVTRAPFDRDLWREVVGNGDLAQILSVEKIEPKISGFRNMSCARQGFDYVCLPGAVTCIYQVGMTKDHTEPDQPCNHSPNGAHDYRMRLFYRPDGDYREFVPNVAQILPFHYFTKVALGKISVGKKTKTR